METSPPSPFVSFRGRPTESNKLAAPSKSGRFPTVICGEFTVNRLGNCANVSWSRNAAIATFPLKLPLRILRLPPSSPPKLNHGKSTLFPGPVFGVHRSELPVVREEAAEIGSCRLRGMEFEDG